MLFFNCFEKLQEAMTNVYNAEEKPNINVYFYVQETYGVRGSSRIKYLSLLFDAGSFGKFVFSSSKGNGISKKDTELFKFYSCFMKSLTKKANVLFVGNKEHAAWLDNLTKESFLVCFGYSDSSVEACADSIEYMVSRSFIISKYCRYNKNYGHQTHKLIDISTMFELYAGQDYEQALYDKDKEIFSTLTIYADEFEKTPVAKVLSIEVLYNQANK